jgi:hypothetical protein
MVVIPAVYFGNIEYFHLLLEHNEIGISTVDGYRKQTYRNRCSILTANGVMKLSIPVDRTNGANTLTSEAQITYAANWQKDHLKALESAYRKSPYYEFYIDGLEAVFAKQHTSLIEFNLELTQWLIDRIGLSCTLQTINRPLGDEYKFSVDPKNKSTFNTYPYIQTFSERFEFEPNLSVLDLLFNEGPNSISILTESKKG